MAAMPSRCVRGASALALGLALGLGAGGAHAGLFDDGAARKAIVDLRSRIAMVDEQAKTRGTEQATAQAAML